MSLFGRNRLRLPLLLLFLSQISQGEKVGFWCGDVWTHSNSQCVCGKENMSYNAAQWCCATNCTGGCLRWMDKKSWVNETWVKTGEYTEGDDPVLCKVWLPAICTTGVTLNLTQSCNKKCNQNLQDLERNWHKSRSHVAACVNTSTCIKEGQGEGGHGNYSQTICTGDSSCEGELNWCRDEVRKEENCPGDFVRCIGSNTEEGNGTKSIPGQCIHPSKMRDGRESNCLDRSDEDPFQEATNSTDTETVIDFANIKNCTSSGRPGLVCDGQMARLFATDGCLTMDYWCLDLFSLFCPAVLGVGIRTNDPTLCSNNTFWRQQTCGKGAVMLRCQAANSGQCVYKKHWGVEGAKDVGNKFGAEASCKDGSDKYRPIKQPTAEEEPGRQALQAEYKERDNNNFFENVAEEKPTASDKRHSAEEHGGQHKQVWKTEPVSELNYDFYFKGKEEGEKYRRDPLTGIWFVPESNPFKVPSITEEEFEKGPELVVLIKGGVTQKRKEEWANFYSSNDYVKDKITNQMVVAPTEETCDAYDGFNCKVGLYDYECLLGLGEIGLVDLKFKIKTAPLGFGQEI